LPTVFAFAGPVARLPTLVRATLQCTSTNLTTSDFREPTRLVLHLMLSAKARLCCEEWAFGATLIVLVAIVRHLRMSARLRSFAIKAAWRRLGTARQGRLKDGTSTVATQLVEDGFPTRAAGTFVAELLTKMIAAL